MKGLLRLREVLKNPQDKQAYLESVHESMKNAELTKGEREYLAWLNLSDGFINVLTDTDGLSGEELPSMYLM